MILGGACGAFSHLLLECLKETQDRICEELLVASPERRSEQLHQMVEKKLYKKELRMAGYSIGQMDANEDKKQFFLSHVPVISFDYSAVTGQAELSDCAAECLGLESRVLDIRGSRWTEQAGPAAIQILRLLQETGPKDPERTAEIKLQLKEERIPCRVVVRSLWTTEDPPQYLGAVGTALPVNQKKEYKTCGIRAVFTVKPEKGAENMTLKDCYEQMGADFEDVLSRLRNEALIRKFVCKFLDDKSIGDLKRAMEAGNQKEAFLAVHTLKGVAQNLGFTPLYEAGDGLTELLRPGHTVIAQEAKAGLEAVEAAYEKTAGAVRQFLKEQGE